MADASAPLDVRDTFGMLALGTILGSLFYGMTLLQAGMFFGKSGNERLSLTLLVIVLCIFDTMSWILEVYTTWHYFVANYANPAALAEPLWALKLEPAFTYTIAFIAQMFFIEKIWLLSQSLVAGISTISLAAWALGLTITGLVFSTDLLVSTTINNVNIGQKTLSTLVEVMIAIGMSYLFRVRFTGQKSTDSMLYRLTIFAVSRGVVLSVLQIVYTGLVFGYNDKLYWAVTHFILGKICTNSVLASLNVREIMRDGGSSNHTPNSIALHSTGPSRTAIIAGSDVSPGTHIFFRRVSDPSMAATSKMYSTHPGDGEENTADAEAGSAIHGGTESYKHLE
ncbi:hypothetical protein FA95DRAFT_586287 [Auriscalpium vulgare]|uniref:Uncharacterized protein n=1 Tax=Auriscalpium vulgare TaxID=40419 RepID=A0ACB8REM0_9AGAM|nr:hypothetical protein FA95DRAFT_586287 [Auriscalpium vulgare]